MLRVAGFTSFLRSCVGTRSKGKMRKSYLIAFIDDHSCLVPYGQFYLSEAIGSYLDAFEKALSKRGLPRKLYVDNGPAFHSKYLEQITASLNIALPNIGRAEYLALYFRKAARRKVAKDRTITLNSRLYEAPVPLIGKQVQLLYHEHDMRQVEALWNQKSYGFLTPVNLTR